MLLDDDGMDFVTLDEEILEEEMEESPEKEGGAKKPGEPDNTGTERNEEKEDRKD